MIIFTFIALSLGVYPLRISSWSNECIHYVGNARVAQLRQSTNASQKKWVISAWYVCSSLWSTPYARACLPIVIIRTAALAVRRHATMTACKQWVTSSNSSIPSSTRLCVTVHSRTGDCTINLQKERGVQAIFIVYIIYLFFFWSAKQETVAASRNSLSVRKFLEILFHWLSIQKLHKCSVFFPI